MYKFNLKKYFKVEIFLFINFSILISFNSALEAHHLTFYTSLIKPVVILNILFFLFKLEKKLAFTYLLVFMPLSLIGGEVILKISSMLFIFYIFYNLALKFTDEIKNILFLVLVLNAVFIIVEINGLLPELVSYQIYYSGNATFRPALFVENGWFPLFQIRPSGVFHSTIYLSFEMIFIMAILMYPIKNNLSILFMTFVSVFSGSTALSSVMFILMLFTVKVNSSKVIFKVFVFMMFWLLMYYFLYPSFFLKNYNFIGFFGSFLTRFDMNANYSSFSANQSMFLLIAIFILFSTLLYLAANQFKFKFRYIYMISVVVIILAVHNFISSFKFYANVGLFFGFVHAYYKLNLEKNEISKSMIKTVK